MPMTFEKSRALALAIAQRNAAQTGMSNLLLGAADVHAPYEPVKGTMAALAETYVRAEREIISIVEEAEGS